MKTNLKALAAAVVLTLVIIPVCAAAETAGSSELTLGDFQQMYAGQKAIVAQTEFARYQHRMTHPAPSVTLTVSALRGETFADYNSMFQGQKPIVAKSEYALDQYRQKHPVKAAVGTHEKSERILKPWLGRS